MKDYQLIKEKFLKTGNISKQEIEFLILKIETEDVKKMIIKKYIGQEIYFCKKLDDDINKEFFIEILNHLLLTI